MMKKIAALINKWNDAIALTITKMVSTMWCVYLFAGMVMIPFALPATLATVQFISSALLQLLFLPLILVGQNLMGKNSERRAEQDHKMIRKEFSEIQDLLNELKDMHQDLHDLISKNSNTDAK